MNCGRKEKKVNYFISIQLKVSQEVGCLVQVISEPYFPLYLSPIWVDKPSGPILFPHVTQLSYAFPLITLF